jgi:hypothetical protein
MCELGENEIEHETIVLQGKRGGSYVGLSDQLRAEFVPCAWSCTSKQSEGMHTMTPGHTIGPWPLAELSR